MNDKRLCSVIRDLLPLYMEQLVSEETGQIVDKHIEECISCKSLYDSMKEDSIEDNKQIIKNIETTRELDYLKKIRKKSRKKLWIGIGIGIFLIAIIMMTKIFIYGKPSEGYQGDISIEDGQIKIKGTLSDSVYSHYKIVEEKGQKKLVVYAVAESIFNKNRNFEINCSLEEAKQHGLIIDNQKITKSGDIVSMRAVNIFEKKHPYIGDMSKNNDLANAIGIAENLGAYTNELKTNEEPYGWTLNFQTTLEETNEKIFNEKMRAYAYVLLATVDNVDEINWSYKVNTEEGMEQHTQTLTRSEADEVLGENVKTFGASEERIEELLVKVGIG